MKKFKIIFAAFVSALLVFNAGCTKEETKPESFESTDSSKTEALEKETLPVKTKKPEQTPKALTDEEETAEPVEAKSETSAAEGWETVREYTADMDADGADDVISLYTSAMREDGEFMWDDSHSWLLEIKTGDGKYYPLYKTDNSHGSVYFSVGEEYGDKVVPLVYMYRASGAGTALEKFTFENGGYIKRTLYDSDSDSGQGINIRYSSMEQYRG